MSEGVSLAHCEAICLHLPDAGGFQPCVRFQLGCNLVDLAGMSVNNSFVGLVRLKRHCLGVQRLQLLLREACAKLANRKEPFKSATVRCH